MVPDRVCKIITERAKDCIILSLGSGPDAHGQLLIYHDMFGLYPKFKPKMAKVFGNAGEVLLNGFAPFFIKNSIFNINIIVLFYNPYLVLELLYSLVISVELNKIMMYCRFCIVINIILKFACSAVYNKVLMHITFTEFF